MKSKLIKQNLSLKQKVKTENDLEFIKLVTRIGKEQGLRIIIHGGYAVDGYFGEITRPHDDIDIQIYGKSNDSKKVIGDLLETIGKKNNLFKKWKLIDKIREEYYHNIIAKNDSCLADLYYLQVTTNPFSKNKVIVKKDGTLSETHKYDNFKRKINGFVYEITNPLNEITDKIYKREHRGDPKLTKHEQDIKNLEKLLPKHIISSNLQKRINN